MYREARVDGPGSETMTTITIDELRERLDEVIDQLAHGGEPVAVTRGGGAVAEINPTATAGVGAAQETTPSWAEEEREAYWAEWDRIATEIGKTWPEGLSAVDAIREDRSRLDTIGEDPRDL